MLELAMHITIETLWKLGKNKTEISNATGHDWKTVDKVIKSLETTGTYPVKKPHPNKLDNYKEKILQLLEQDLSGVRIHEELIKLGADTSYASVKKYITEIKGSKNVCVRFHTNAGEEAQVDFGYVGLGFDKHGVRRKCWVFNMRLSYSRLDYYERVFDQKVETFIQCHINAFKFFGGVPKCVKIDNLKAAILEAHFYEPVYQTLYKQFATHYGFNPVPCRVRQPQEKGKVEAGIKYIKGNFFAGRKFRDYNDTETQLFNWLKNTCNNRIHGTTRKIPYEVFIQEENSQLIQLPTTEFKLPTVGQRKVFNDCHIFVNYNYYSVPYNYVGKIVTVEIINELVKISYNGQQIALHQLSSGKGNFITCTSHYPKYKNYLSTEYQEQYQVKLNNIGYDAGELFLLLLNKYPYNWNRIAQGVLSLTKSYSKEVVNLACKRALAFNVVEYRIIKNMCQNGSYALPIDTINMEVML